MENAYISEIMKPQETLEVPYVMDEEQKEKRHARKVLFLRAAVGIFIIAFWEIASRTGLIDSYYWSSPSMILEAAKEQWLEKDLWGDIWYTSSATIYGFALGTAGGAVLGLSFWWSKTASDVSEPYMIMFNAIPKLALGPIIVVLFGVGFSSKVILAFLMTVITCAISTYSGVQSVDASVETLLYSLGANRWQVFTKVVIPSTLPWIISSLRINISLALAGTIVGEFIASSKGLGRMVIYAGTILDTTLVWVGVVILSIVAMVMYLAVVQLEKWLNKHLAIQNI